MPISQWLVLIPSSAVKAQQERPDKSAAMRNADRRHWLDKTAGRTSTNVTMSHRHRRSPGQLWVTRSDAAEHTQQTCGGVESVGRQVVLHVTGAPVRLARYTGDNDNASIGSNVGAYTQSFTCGLSSQQR